jgi:hypothetical protein
VRSSPSSSANRVGELANGAKIGIQCQVSGRSVSGTYGTSSIWDRIGKNKYVSDAYVYTGRDGFATKKCGASTPPPPPSGGGSFNYDRIVGVSGNHNVTDAFITKVEKVSSQIGTKPEYLMAVMSFESGGSFDSCKKNAAGSGATGLIQFMPSTTRGLGTSTAKLCSMGEIRQLDYVKKYFGGSNSKYRTIEGLYTKVLAGAAHPNPSDVLFRRGSSAYKWNAPLDWNHDGKITAGEAAKPVKARIK